MGGYAWTGVLVRYTPRDGAVETANLSTGFLDAGVARSVLTKAVPRYVEENERQEDINFNDQSLRRGISCEVALTFEVVDMASHHPTIATLVSRANDPYWKVELSLDNGTTYRQVKLRRAGSPAAFGGKTAAGAKIEHLFRCTALLSGYPEIGGGTSW
jgi:hypothetical protein